MELLGESCGYILHRNAEGFIEGFKKKGSRMIGQANIGTGLSHVTTDCKTIEEFEQLMAANKKKSSIKPDQPKLFDDTIL